MSEQMHLVSEADTGESSSVLNMHTCKNEDGETEYVFVPSDAEGEEHMKNWIAGIGHESVVQLDDMI